MCCSFYSGYKPLFPYFFFQRKNTYTTSVGLFRISFTLENGIDIGFYLRINTGCPAKKLLRVPITNKLMRRRKVFFGSGIAEVFGVSFIECDALFIIKYSYIALGVDQLYFFANILIGNTVVVFLFSSLGHPVMAKVFVRVVVVPLSI